MSAEATARAPEAAAAEPRNLEFYRTRDDIMRAYAPQTDEERLLVLQIARAWYRLQKFYDLEASYLEQGLTDLFTNDIERYKTLCRTVAEAERAWRHAVTMFERARAQSRKSATIGAGVRSGSRGTPIRTEPAVPCTPPSRAPVLLPRSGPECHGYGKLRSNSTTNSAQYPPAARSNLGW